MNRQEFLDTCKKCGYIKKEIAEKYAEDKLIFTDADFEACAIASTRQRQDHTARFKHFDGTLSTKNFNFKGSDRQ
jgi:hypothetical protein